MTRLGMRWAFGILVAGLLLGVAVPASAQVDCSEVSPDDELDSDRDGLSDGGECGGLTLWVGSAGAGQAVVIPPCPDPVPEHGSAARRTCVDVNSRDGWVFLLELSQDSLVAALFPDDPTADHPFEFEFAENTGITVHVFHTSDASLIPGDRVIAPGDSNPSSMPQKGVQITEVGGTSEIFGVANWGTPQGIDFSRVFSHAIQAFVDENCTRGCQDVPSGGTAGPAAIGRLYLIHTLNHELLHDWQVEEIYDGKVNGYHASPSKKNGPFLMEPFVVVKRGKFHIGTIVEQSTRAAALLR